MIHRISLPHILSSLLAIVLGLFLYLLFMLDVLNIRLAYISLSVLLLVYLSLEVDRVRRVHPERWLVNPAVLGSFMTFVLSYGATNALFFLPAKNLELLGLVPDVTPAMVKLMWLVLVAAIAMWWGYWSPIAAYLSRTKAISRFQSRFLPRLSRLKSLVLPSIMVLAIGARILQIRLGVFGYSSIYDRLIEMGSVTQYLAMVAGLGKLALVLAALQFFSNRNSIKARIWLYSLLALEVFWGLLSGFKSAVVMPFVIAGLCQYLTTGKLPKLWITCFIAAIFAAYTIIEPFRVTSMENPAFTSATIPSIAETMLESRTIDSAGDSAPVLISLASRFNLSYIGSFGVAYADDTPDWEINAPRFLNDIMLAPAHAWIPRLLWESKSVGNIGLWYTQEVLGLHHFSSTGMGPVTYLYFAGGVVAVFIGFFCLGIIQRALFFLLQPWASLAGAMIFLNMLQTVTVIDSAVNGMIITWLRELPILFVLQLLIFVKARRQFVGGTSPQNGRYAEC